MNENIIKIEKGKRSKLILIICGIILFLIASFIIGFAIYKNGEEKLVQKRIESIKSAEVISTWDLAWNACYNRFRAKQKYANGSYYLIKVDETGTLTDDYYSDKITTFAPANEIYLSASLAKTGINSLKNGTYICGKIYDIGFYQRYFDLSFVANEITIYMTDAYLVTEEELKKISEIDTNFYKNYLCKTKEIVHDGYNYEQDPFLKYYLFDKVDLSTENIFDNKQWDTLEHKFQLTENSFVYGDYNKIHFSHNIATISSSHNNDTYTVNYSIDNGILYIDNSPMSMIDVRKISDDYYVVYYELDSLLTQYLILFDETTIDCTNNIKQQ